MKFWSFLAAKFMAAGLVLFGLYLALNRLLPEPATILTKKLSRFPQDLRWTSALLVLWLLAVVLAYFILEDQRRRCRTCVRRLRMPVEHGSWSEAILFAPPHTESICPYGHGTLHAPDTHLSAAAPASWQPHGDIWQELFRPPQDPA